MIWGCTRSDFLKTWMAGSLLYAASVLLLTPSIRGNPADPWMPAETLEPAQLLTELQRQKDPNLTLIYVGMKALYAGAHIPGALYYGAGSTEQGINELKKFAASLPKSADVVLYCGCCPLEKCPNLRPAFRALKETGLARLRVLILPTSFHADWVEKGYPIHQGSTP
jgi:hypothetical protein